MKKIAFIIALLFSVSAVNAQLNNSWIDYSKTYYKFKIAQSGLYRINQPLLASIGLGSVPAEQFQLWRNGTQQRIYTSVSTGVFSSSDYIEFWGLRNDGVADNSLYRDPYYQLSDSFSLDTDTASYFLTVNTNTAANLRFNTQTNDVAGNTLPAEPYFMNKLISSYRNQYNRGYAAIVGEYVYSSSYDQGEGWTSNDIVPCCDLFKQFDNLNVYTSGPQNNVSFYISAFGNALYTRNLRVKFFNTTLFDTVQMDYFKIRKKQVDNIPLSILQGQDYLQVAVNGYTPPPGASNVNDRIVVGEMWLSYPSKFNFNNKKNFYFELGPTAAGNYLVIDNFNTGNVPPVLYSMNDGSRYVGDLSIAGKVQFVLPPSTDVTRKFYLVSQELNNITAVNNISTRNFVNFTTAANQGDYIIIAHPSLFNDGNGVNYVEQYRQYRASAQGRSFNAKIVEIDELNDQFAFGIKKHPAAIRDFIRYANLNFTVKPKYVLLMGRGMSSLEFKQNESNPIAEQIDLVQSFGWPASDVLLACEPGTNVPLVPIGRLGVINGGEIRNYLNKLQEYEQVQSSTSQTIADKAWMKNVIHIAGGQTIDETNSFVTYLNEYKATFEDTSYGGRVETFIKTSTAAVEQANGLRIEQLINNGVGFIQYFGHSSANTLAFNLNAPESYSNQGKYPFFSISGCSAGNFYIFDPTRVTGGLSISEKYVLADQRGSIGFLASTHLGIPPFLHFYNTQVDKAIVRDMYGNTIGNQIQRALQVLGANPQTLDYYTRIHLEEMNLHGDPAVKLYTFSLPDYVVEDPSVKINPTIVSVADASFNVAVKIQNIGKAINDSIRVQVKRILPSDTVQVLYNQLIRATLNSDSLSLDVPINPITDKGLNKIIVTLDVNNRVAELSENNNTVTKEFIILEDEVRPVYPYNYSIVNRQNITYVASSANPLNGNRQYQMEVDTTETFNSPFKKSYTLSGSGGLIQFSPTNITFTDSTVYYWRTSITPLNGGSQQVWNTSSFVYLPNGGTGFNQSHFYQHQKSQLSSSLSLDNDRVFRFKDRNRNINIKTGVYPFTQYDRINVTLDFDQLESYGCRYGSLQIIVYDSATMEPWKNFNTAGSGQYGSAPICDPYTGGTRNMFEFPYNDAVYRKAAMDFLDAIPNGMYVSITNLGWTVNNSFIDEWQADQATLGTGNSLYHKLKSYGFTKIDSFTRNLPFIYFFRKGVPAFAPRQTMGAAPSDQPNETYVVVTKFLTGTIESPAFGPSTRWDALHWYGTTADLTMADTAQIEVYGVTNSGTEDLLTTVTQARDTTLAFIDAATYPYVKLKMLNTDVKYATPNQLKFWRINAAYVPEGAVAPNLLFSMKDTADQGERIDFRLAFKNISDVAFDSIRVKFIITDKNNTPHIIPLTKLKRLQPGDTATVAYNIDGRTYPGINTLYVDVNPDNDQPEQYHFNNFLFKNFYINEDGMRPVLDVTFDGIHILNRDYVSNKPHILIKLKDESKFVALSDTALFKVQVRYPDGSLHGYFFGSSLQFTPANLSTGDNTATVDFYPEFTEDGDYELLVSGKDMAGNKAGDLDYRVTFTVKTAATISNVFNYPNPFTTSTAFVFTITGEVPQNMRIQILTITGKIVREITKDELGPIHVGNNITDFKWDGTDAYGQQLANGVYLYRVITNLNGKSVEKLPTQSNSNNTDVFFNNGYGKMYLMR